MGTLAAMCALLMAPQTTEFGAKVGLLAGCGRVPAARSDRPAGRRPRSNRRSGSPLLPVFGRGAALGASLVLAGTAGGRRRDPRTEQPRELTGSNATEVEVDVGALPPSRWATKSAP